MTYIQTARTPTLIQHGDQDHRVPIPNAYELYQGLQDMGVEVQLHVYPGMAHSSSKPRTQRHIMESNYTWFNRWIWGEVPPLPQEKTIHVALAHGETDSSEDNLPAAERYRAGWIRERRLAAQREGEAFFLFSGAFGLVEPDFPTPPGEKALLPEEVSAMAVYLTETLRNEGAQRVIFYTPPAKQAPWALIYLGCLQVAAGIAGGITVEHQEVKEAAAGA